MKIIKYTFPLVFAFLGFLIYSNILNAPFIFDDLLYITNNYKVHNISTFFKDFSGTRYIGFLSFAINYHFGGLNTFGYHLVNIIIHILNAILVYFFVSLTLKIVCSCPIYWAYLKNADKSACYLPLATALIFLVHPIQTQAVSYITQRFASLATLFYLLALVLYVKARLIPLNPPLEKGGKGGFLIFYLASIIFTILAMKTKEISFTLPFIIILYEFTFFREEPPLPLRERVGVKGKRFLYLLPFFLTLLIIPLTLVTEKGIDEFAPGADIGEMIRGLQIRDIKDISIYSYLITQFKVILIYIGLLLIPINQHFEYDFPLSHSIFELATFLSFIFLISILICIIYIYIRSWKTNNGYGLLISFGILWFFITLSVESSIIPIKDVIFEHRVYLPSSGFILSVTAAILYGFDYLEKRTGKPLTYYLSFLIFIITVSFSFSVYQRNILWSDEYMIWLDNVIKSPNNPVPRNNLGVMYEKKGLLEEALKEYKLAIEIEPNFSIAHYNIGVIYGKKGMLDEAIEQFKQTLKISSNFAMAHHGLGVAYLRKGMIDDAIKEFEKYIEIIPYYLEAYYNLASAYEQKGLLSDVINVYQKLLKIYPNSARAHKSLGIVYYKKEQLDDAIKEFKKALEIKPDYYDAHNSLGTVYYKKGQIDDAIKEFQETIRLSPTDTLAHYNLFNAFAKKKNKEQTLKYYNKFIEQAKDKSFEPSIAKAKKILQELQYE